MEAERDALRANFSSLTKDYEELIDTLIVTREERDKAERSNAALEAENRALREALAPFARLVEMNAIQIHGLMHYNGKIVLGPEHWLAASKTLAPKEGNAP